MVISDPLFEAFNIVFRLPILVIKTSVIKYLHKMSRHAILIGYAQGLHLFEWQTFNLQKKHKCLHRVVFKLTIILHNS